MRKYLLAALASVCISTAVLAQNQETISGEIISTDGNNFVLFSESGEEMNFKTTDNTRYRKKTTKQEKMAPKHKHNPNRHKHKGKPDMTGLTFYSPFYQNNDWVEVVYTVPIDKNSEYIVEDIIIYND